MMRLLLNSLLIALVCLSGAVTPYRLLGNFTLSHPSFLAVFPVSDINNPDLFITSFKALGSGGIYTVPKIGTLLGNVHSIKPATTSGSENWPNDIFLAPPGMFSDPTIVWADGFLVPGKSDGYIYAMHYSNDKFATPVALTKKKSGYFYHQVVFYDMNSDGLLDIVTARVNMPMIGSSKGEFMWLECPQDVNARDSVWTEHVITQGPDVDFFLGDLDNDDSTIEVVAPQFFTETLNIYQINKADLTLKAKAVIDNTIGPPYAVSVNDFNQNNKMQLLVTNHAGKQKDSGMFLYDIPSDVINGKWTRHQIGSQFPISASGFNQAAPGFAYPTTQKVGSIEYPSILVAGDGAQRAYFFTRTNDYEYSQQEVIYTKGVVGSIATGDVDGDGWNEFFVPDYDHGVVYIYTFAPATP